MAEVDAVPERFPLIQDTAPMRARTLQTGPLAVIKVIYNLFSTVDKREPPSASKTIHLRLITIRISHFCEKARWALDLLDEDETSPYWYTEDAHPAGLHAMETVRASHDQGSSTPMVVMGDKVLMKSDLILHTFHPGLYPNERVKEMEGDMGQRLGATVRVYAYHAFLLQDECWEALKSMSIQDCSNIEAVLFGKMKDDLAKIIRKSMNINDETAAQSKAMIAEIFEEYSKILEKQEYLVGNEFTAADLTFAALGGALLRPPEMSNFQCTDDQVPESVMQFIRELRETKAGQHVMKVYAKHRFKSPGKNKAFVKKANRNRFPWLELGFVAGGVAVFVAVAVRMSAKS